MAQIGRPDQFLVEPGHLRADQEGERHAGEGQSRRDIAADKAPKNEVQLADRPRIEHLLGLEALVPENARGEQRCGNNGAENREYQEVDRQGIGRVDIGRTTATDLDVVNGDATKGQQEENGEDGNESG